MTDYHFTGAHPRILTGLSQGVNALIFPVDRDTPPYGSTIEAHPGDALQTDEPYEHPELTEVESDDDEDEDASDAHGLSLEDEAWAQANPKPKPPHTTTPAPADPTEN